jgi:peptidoglycan/LPS O-acetylase OafA/YrhL
MRRIPELDALRGLAALAIVVYHLWVPQVTLLGTAVDLFFVLSGYLITSIILGQVDRPGFLRTFYARRALRIWPIYYLSLLALVALSPFLPGPSRLDGLPYYLTYTQRIQDYWFGEVPPFLPAFRHTWTLAIEEQFYLAWPLLIALLGRRSVVPLALGVASTAVVARLAGFTPWILLTHGDGLALGGLLAVILGGERAVSPSRATRWALALAFVGPAFYLALGDPAIRLLGMRGPSGTRTAAELSLRMLAINLSYFGAVGLVVVHAGRRALAPLRDRRLCYLGQISYGIYLYHHIIFMTADQLGFGGGPAADAAKLAASFALAVVSWECVERPILSLKGRFSYGPPRGARPAAMPEIVRLGAEVG